MLGITNPAVTIKNIEASIIDRGFEEGWVVPNRQRNAQASQWPLLDQDPAA